ncbi:MULTISPECIES: SDR family NAD(P)-dependent oxidoreductase [Haloferax]|uniref:SDR family oxidoreductase n=2 Tax=Haloferax TaxID=2251 RepID=A0A6G1Z448_9EURY|nr:MULTISPECIES: SDR family NAD(P)-dependent oxidoreductase [Haloferax]KAB1188575.1 SDR family oxidoreductase [Haloferax sp. CBA1149]MRW81273.1 SDR family oxidoreductase [Haloferax marinisediminis]
MSTDSPLGGKVSIVTGAGGQIGEGIAVELAKAGSDVVIADVNVLDTEYNQQSSKEVGGAKRAEEVAARVEELGRRAHIVECDVTHADQVSAMVEETVSEFGGIDVLCNNAGIITVDSVEEMKEGEWDSVMDVNVKGVFLVSQAAIPHLKESNGTIINTASIAGSIGAAGLAHYCASKHAVLGFTKSLSLELAGDDVTVNAICPGIVDTPMWNKVLTPTLEEDYKDTIERVIPLGRDQSPEDMGRLAVFFATNRNITGQSVVVDGGILQNVI